MPARRTETGAICAFAVLLFLGLACASGGSPTDAIAMEVADDRETGATPHDLAETPAEETPPDTPPDTEGAPDPADSADATDAPSPEADGPDAVPTGPLPAPGPGFHRGGNAILDSQGRTVVLHGVNVANQAKYVADHLPWQTAQNLVELAGAGFNVVRLLTFWGALMPTEGVIDDAYLDQFVQRVEWAAQAGLLVVVDMHQDIFGFGFGDNGAPRWACDEALYAAYQPQEPWYLNYLSPQVEACFDRFYKDDALFGRFTDAWLAVANRLKDHPAVIGFDLLNEPSAGSRSPEAFITDAWQPRQEQLAASLHAIAPGKLAFFEGTTLSSLGHVDPFVPPAAPGVVFAPHYYHPFVHDGGTYDPSSMAEQIDFAMDGMAQMAAALGNPPVWVGEWGGPTAIPGFDTYLEDLLRRFAARRWSWAYYCDDPPATDAFGIRLADGTFNPLVVRRLGHPYARRLPGPLQEQAADVATGVYSARFTWAWDAPVEAWTAPGGLAADVTLAAVAGGDRIPCEPLAGAPPGVVTCPAAGAGFVPAWGTDYLIQVAVPVPPPAR